MNWIMRDQEFENVSLLAAPQRYEYFVKKVVDWQLVWSLAGKEGWVLAATGTGQEAVPAWPHERFASACRSGAWTDTQPRSIALSAWIRKWLPGIKNDNRLVAVFPLPSDRGVVMDSDQLMADLEAEMSLYDDDDEESVYEDL